MARSPVATDAAVEEGGYAAQLEVAAAPWLKSLRERMGDTHRAGRMPHALLVHGASGSGQSALAVWVAQLVLCDRPRQAPCNVCPSCVLFVAGNHPDLRVLGIEEKATEIKIDQVRELSERLTLTSYRGGFKVGIIDPADRMNRSSFNALLKTLEEPPKETVLILAAARIDHMPATIASRCQRLRIPTPPPELALDWLGRQEGRAQWDTLLKIAGGAPLAALELARSGTDQLAADMAHALGERANRDPLVLAAAWFKDRPQQRLAWLEAWLEGGIHALAGASDAVNNKCDFGLPLAGTGVNIRAAFTLLDRVRETRAALDGPLNTQLLFEDLLVGLTEALAGRMPMRLETGR